MPAGPNDDDDVARALAPTVDASSETEPRGDGPVVVQRHSVGRFRIDAELGSGGMADVFRAYDPVLDRAVALKVLHTQLAADSEHGMRRVLREARAAAALTHPNTVTIFEVGEADGQVFIAMELLTGSVLRDVMDRGEASLQDKLRWLLQAARALAAAHARGLVHRDVKPENMFVCADGSLKLLDFGIAKRDREEGLEADAPLTAPSSMRTQAGRRLGTPRYMAPEQHAGLPTDARTDEYAWGLVAFELLRGSQIAGEQPTATSEGGAAPAGAASAMRLTELRVNVPGLPPAVAASIARALEPNMDDRFPSMDPIVHVLELGQTTAPRRSALAPRHAWLIVFLAASIAAIGVVLARLREHGGVVPAKSASESPSPAPACRTLSDRRVPLAENERVAVMPDGGFVLARHGAHGLSIERVTTADERSPFLRSPVGAFESLSITSLRLRGTTLSGDPSVFVLTTMEDKDTAARIGLMSFGESGRSMLKSVGGHPNGIATTQIGDRLVTAVTSVDGDPRLELGPGLSLYLLGDPRFFVVETGPVSGPALAATPSRLAVAYQHATRTHFALFDADLNRLGDILTALPFPATTAIAFTGADASVFWTDTRTPRTRLYQATLAPPAKAFGAPTLAIDEPLVDTAPITVRLPDGSSAVAWLTSTGGPPTLRISPVGVGGALTGPSDVASGTTFHDLEATTTARGIGFSWNDGAGTAHIAHVTCEPPPGARDR